MSAPVDAEPGEPGGSDRLKGHARTIEYRGRAFGRNVDLWQQRHAVIAFPWGVYRKYADDSGGRAAAQLAYYALFSIAPLMLVFVVILANLLDDRPELRADMVNAIFGAFPELEAQVGETIAAVPANNWALVIGVLGVLYAGLGVTESAQYAFNQIWAVPWRIRPGFFPRQGRALGMTLLLYAGLIGYALIATWSGVASNHDTATRVAVLAGSAAVLFGVILVSYWVLCGRKLTYWQVWPGTLAFLVVTAIVIPFLSGIFSRLVAGLQRDLRRARLCDRPAHAVLPDRSAVHPHRGDQLRAGLAPLAAGPVPGLVVARRPEDLRDPGPGRGTDARAARGHLLRRPERSLQP